MFLSRNLFKLHRVADRIVDRLNYKDIALFEGDLVGRVAETKLRMAMIFGVKTQAVNNRMAGIAEKINHIFFAPDMVNDDILIPEIFSNFCHGLLFAEYANADAR